ncbi:PP0621 family protein [Bordetella genomosp. 5]|uniref:PP0621 family protein n=1 Tax=Bordetella genomosp. 5 TaxID=1395608 RepID=UPI00148365C1|nr:PP0621 family protein [Bordetella genomosp. 5]
MGKILFWVLVILAVLMIARIAGARAAQRKKPQARPQAASRPSGSKNAPVPSEPMVRCAHCGIHLPRSEALLQQGQTWCSAEHARLGKPGG